MDLQSSRKVKYEEGRELAEVYYFIFQIFRIIKKFDQSINRYFLLLSIYA